MVQNWKILFVAILLIQACSGSKYRKADCYDCTTEKQSWNKFSWNLMEGHWRGNLETVTNEVAAKGKVKKEEAVDVHFVTGTNFFQTYKIESCGDFPKNSFVMLGQSWQAGEKEKVFEVFAEGAEDTVVYGRTYITKMNGQNVCQFKAYGGTMAMNRLALPAVRFTQRMTSNGRALASGSTPEMEVNFEFLNFEPKWMDKKPITTGGRKPASVQDQERPPLFFRVFQTTRNVNGPYSNGEWTSTKEYLYRLWKVE